MHRHCGTAETRVFPDRLKPINIKSDVDRLGEFRSIRQTDREIRRLNPASYAPPRCVPPRKQEAYDRTYSTETRSGEGFFRQVDREEGLVHSRSRHPAALFVSARRVRWGRCRTFLRPDRAIDLPPPPALRLKEDMNQDLSPGHS